MDYSPILKYFPELSEEQQYKFVKMGDLYARWNEKINVISRKDIDNFYLHHVLHSLAIAKFWSTLNPGTAILDMGTGGGFPGVPLAVMYPQCNFHLIDRIGKKLTVVSDVCKSLDINNITVQHGDIGECRARYDYVVSRAVMRLDTLVPLIRKNVSNTSANKYANGLICLKGGDIGEETMNVAFPVIEYPLNEFFSEEYFSTKLLVYVPIKN